MIAHSDLKELMGNDVFKTMGFTYEYFYSLPVDCQNEIMIRLYQNNCVKNNKFKIQRNNFQKRIALKQYELEEKVKEKVLSIFSNRK